MRSPRLPGSLAAGLLAAGVVAAMFGGCGGSKAHVAIPSTTLKAPRPVTVAPSGGSTSTTSSTTVPTAPATTATTSASRAPGSAAGAGVPASNPTTTVAPTPSCATAGLTATVGGPADAGAGSVTYVVAFQNSGTVTCALSGYPGVSAIDGSGNQIGAPADKTGVAAQVVTIAPGAKASVGVRASQAANYGSGCQQQTSAALRIYPPGQTASLSVPLAIAVCANSADHTLQVNPVVPGVAAG